MRFRNLPDWGQIRVQISYGVKFIGQLNRVYSRGHKKRFRFACNRLWRQAVNDLLNGKGVSAVYTFRSPGQARKTCTYPPLINT